LFQTLLEDLLPERCGRVNGDLRSSLKQIGMEPASGKDDDAPSPLL